MLIQLEGEYTVERAAELKAELQACLNEKEPVELNFQGVTGVDLSFFLVLHSAKKTYAHHENILILNNDLPSCCAKEAQWAGLSELVRPMAANE